jgi:hypothetical protein
MQQGRTRQFYIRCAVMWAVLCLMTTALGIYILVSGEWFGVFSIVAAAGLLFLTVLYGLSARAADGVTSEHG